MQRRTRPERGNRRIDLAGFVPRTARVVPDCFLHEAVFVRDEVGHGFFPRGEGFDVVRLPMVDEFAHVVCLEFDGGKDGAVANGTVGSEEDEVVGLVCARSKSVIAIGIDVQ